VIIIIVVVTIIIIKVPSANRTAVKTVYIGWKMTKIEQKQKQLQHGVLRDLKFALPQ
jgi:hypothetical protein